MTQHKRFAAVGLATLALVAGGTFAAQNDSVTSVAASTLAQCDVLTGEAKQDCRIDALEAEVFGTPSPSPTTPEPTFVPSASSTPTPTPTPSSTPVTDDPFVTAAKEVGGVTHAYVFNTKNQAKDLVGNVEGTVKGSGTTFGSDGAVFDGRGYIELPDNNDFSVTNTGGLSVVVDVEIDNWKGAGASEYVHWMGKGVSNAHEWTFRHYVDGGTGEASQRQGRVSFYHFNPAGGLGAGSYFQDTEETNPHVVGATADTRQVQIYKDGALRDTDPLSGYNIVPKNTTSPVRIGTRDTTSGFLVGKVRRVAFFNKVLTAAQMQKMNSVPRSTATPNSSATSTPSVTSSPTATSTPQAGWDLQYETNFSNLDGWTLYNNQTQSNDNSINMAKNVSAGSNGLVIAGKRESGFSRPFTSGEIVGKDGQVVPNYFRAEVTGTFRDEQGIWPALLWFRPNNASDGELDVMEWMGGLWSGTQKRVAVTMHNEYGATQDNIKKPMLLSSNPWYDPNVPHTYVIEKVPGAITVSIDNRWSAKFSATDKSWWNRIMEVQDRTWYPRITLQIGQGATTRVVPDPAPEFVATEMNVSSLKFYKQRP